MKPHQAKHKIISSLIYSNSLLRNSPQHTKEIEKTRKLWMISAAEKKKTRKQLT